MNKYLFSLRSLLLFLCCCACGIAVLSGQNQTLRKPLGNTSPLISSLLYQKAVLYAQTNRLAEAIELFSLVEQMEGPSLLVGYQKYTAYLHNDDLDRAQTTIRELYAKYPLNREVVLAYISMLRYTGETGQERTILQNYLKQNPTDLQMLFLQASYQTENKQYAEAKKTLQNVHTENLDQEMLERYYGILIEIAYAEQDYQSALAYGEKLIETTPADPSTLMRHIILLTMNKQTEKANQALVTLGHLIPSNSLEYVHFYSEIMKERKEIDRLLEIQLSYFADKTEITRQEIENIVIPTTAYLHNNPTNDPKAVPLFERLVYLLPNEEFPLEALYEQISRNEGTESAHSKILLYTQSPHHAVAAYEFLLSIASDEQEFNQLLAQAVQQCPTHFPFIAFYTTLLAQKQGNTTQAISRLEKFIHTQEVNVRDKASAALHIADIYYYLEHDKTKAEKWYRQAFEYDENNPLLLNNYAYFLCKEIPQEVDKAVRMASRAVDLSPNSANVCDTYGGALFLQKNFLMAEIFFRKAVEISLEKKAPRANYYENWGDALFMNQKIDEAIAQWNKAYELAPSEKLKNKIEHRRLE